MPTTKLRPLLCELHAHTSWSDGEHSLREVVDLYGERGFDVLAITDHVLPDRDPWLLEYRRAGKSVAVEEEDYFAYLNEIEREAVRARALYDLVLVPGLEVTCNEPDPDLAAHALVLGVRTFVPADGGIVEALHTARSLGAAVVAAHPHDAHPDAMPLRTTRRFWREWRDLLPLVDRFELFNRNDLFGWIAEAGLPAVATGDFHRREHLATWKTLLPCAKDERAVVDYLRSSRPAYLLPFHLVERQASPAAA